MTPNSRPVTKPGWQATAEGSAVFPDGGRGPPAATPEDSQGVAALGPETGKIQWRYGLTQNSLSAGVLSTAGGVLFSFALPD